MAGSGRHGWTGLVLASVAAATAVACDGSGPGSCDQHLAVTPAEPRLAEGDTLQLAVAVACDGAAPLELVWSASDASVVALDAASGRAVGQRAGRTTVVVHAAGADVPADTVELAVFARLFDRIIFSRQRRDAECVTEPCLFQIYTMLPGGGGLTLVVDSLRYPETPRVSPDGRAIVFEDQGRVFLTDAGGGARRELDTGADQSWQPAWSPDGQWIAFTGDSPTFGTQVYRIHPDGTGRRKLTEDLSGGRDPAWTPDGELAYIRGYSDGTGPMGIQAVRIDADGGNPRVLTEGIAGFQGSAPAWSPDGQSVLFLDVVNDDWAVTRLTPATMRYDTLSNAFGNRPGQWSPDGQHIVFGTGDLWQMGADGSDARVVLADGFLNFEAAFTPAAPVGVGDDAAGVRPPNAALPHAGPP